MTTITSSSEAESQVSPTPTQKSHPEPEVAKAQDPPKVAEGSPQKTKEVAETGGEVSEPSTEMKPTKSPEKIQKQREETHTELSSDIRQLERNFVRFLLVLATSVCLIMAVYATVNVVLAEYPIIQLMTSGVILKPHSECDRIRKEARAWVSLAVVRQSYFFIVYYLVETLLAACLLLVIWLPESDPSYTTDEIDSKHPRVILRRADYHIFTSIQRVGSYLLQQTFFVMGLTVYYIDRRLSDRPMILFKYDFFWMLWASKGLLLFVFVAAHFNREYVDEKKGGRTILQWIISTGKFDPVEDMKERMDKFDNERESKSKDKKKKDDTSEAGKSDAGSKETAESAPKSSDETLKSHVESIKTAVDSTESDQTSPPSHPVSDQVFKVGKARPKTVTSSCQTPD